MPTASSAEPPPENAGTNIPRATPAPEGLLRSTSSPKASTTIATSAVSVASSRRNPRTCMPRIVNAARPVITPHSHSDSPKTRFMPSAAPTNSARSVAIATASACSHSSTTTRGVNRSRHTSGRLRPVAMPSLALMAWTTMAVRLAASTTHSSVYPNSEPPAMLVAKFPGSM